MLPTERREASHRRSFVQSILSDVALVMGRAKVQFLSSHAEWNHQVFFFFFFLIQFLMRLLYNSWRSRKKEGCKFYFYFFCFNF
jgi:hypothetical protein